MEVGFHTLRHHNLTVLSDEELAQAMEEGREALEHVVGAPLPLICYPYGFVDRRVANAARRAGFLLGFTSRGGAVTPTSDPLLLARIGPSPHSTNILAVQIVAALVRQTEGQLG
jgi:peptidoglycan/xylan/chitin deacetylase (PgdA/CDA1 family)